MNNENNFNQMKKYFDEQLLLKNLENDAKINLLKEENDNKSKIIKNSEEKILFLERKLFQIGKSI